MNVNCTLIVAVALATGGLPHSSSRTATRGPSPGEQSPHIARAAALPTDSVDTAWPVTRGRAIRVGAGRSLQTAINSASPGDVILLEPGASYVGPFTLRRKEGAGWIIIRSAAPDSLLPPRGRRATPADALLMPKLLSAGNNESVFVTEAGARGYRLVGLEISAQPRVEALNALVRLGDGRADQGAGMPSDLILDRVYIHGTRSLSLQRCVMLSSAKSAIIDSWLSECHAEGIDSQAIVGWNGSGPYAIVNNYLEAAGENVMFGGANPGTVGLVPQDVIIRGNHFRKPDSWIGSRWSVKNLLELKFARRVLIEGNVFEGSWRNAQNGSALILKSSADVPWGNTEDVTIRFNRVRNVGNGFGLRGKEGSSTVNLRRVTIHDNVMDNVNVPPYIGDARLFTITGGVEDVSIVHNTMVSTGYLNALMALDQYPAIVRLTMNENILVKGEYGIKASGAYSGSGSLDRAVHGGYEFKRNVIVGTTNDAYPPSTAFVASIEGIGFSIPGRDYRLAARSFRRAGTGNRDLGADVRTLDSLTATVTVKIPGR